MESTHLFASPMWQSLYRCASLLVSYCQCICNWICVFVSVSGSCASFCALCDRTFRMGQFKTCPNWTCFTGEFLILYDFEACYSMLLFVNLTVTLICYSAIVYFISDCQLTVNLLAVTLTNCYVLGGVRMYIYIASVANSRIKCEFDKWIWPVLPDC